MCELLYIILLMLVVKNKNKNIIKNIKNLKIFLRLIIF